MQSPPGELSVRTDALTRPIRAAERRRLRSPSSPPAPKRWLVTAGAYAATPVVLVIVCVYLVGADLELFPIVGALLLAFVVYSVVVGLKRRHRSAEETIRLDLLAADNGLEIERDIADPDTPGALFREGANRLTVVRLRRRSPRFIEVGRYRATASALDGGRSIDMGDLLVHDAEAARRWASARDADAVASDPSAPPRGGLRAVSLLPALSVEGLPHPLRVDVRGDFVVVYSPDPFPLDVAATWPALAEAVRRVQR